jgi:hypothetical protein
MQQHPQATATKPNVRAHKTPQLLLQQQLGAGQAGLQEGFGVELQVFAAVDDAGEGCAICSLDQGLEL